MSMHIPSPATLRDVLDLIETTQMPDTRRRDMVSAIRRICEMMGSSPGLLSTDVAELRTKLGKILPARHEVTKKTFANQKSLFGSALELAGVIDPMPQGITRKDPRWGPLVKAIAHDKRLSCGLAAFANWCSLNRIHPDDVTDTHVQDFLVWLETRTLCPQPRNVVRRVPNVWNDAAKEIAGWPQVALTPISFCLPSKHLTWEELDQDLYRDAKAYLAMRAEPDLFDENPNAPWRPLAPRTCQLQNKHLRQAASVLVAHGTPVDQITSLGNLVEPEAFKIILRHYHDQAKRKPNASVINLAKTLLQVAKYHNEACEEDLSRLKKLAAKLPSIPIDLTDKNKALMRELDSKRLSAKLIFLPDTLLKHVIDALETPKRCFVDAQVAVAIAILLVAPVRPENLTLLNWDRHFSEPDGPKGALRLRIPKEETKTKKRELVFELPDDVAAHLHWYRRNILPLLNADMHGDLFVTAKGTRKGQDTFTDQIIDRIESHVGVHMTPHQFRHFAAKLNLDVHPEDFRTVTDLLGHASAKTTQIYAGVSSQRASRAYGKIICDQREALKLKRPRRKKK
jgi:integrase